MNLRPVFASVGVIVAFLGLISLMQGIGILPGNIMTGSQFWAVAGGVTFLVGVGIAAAGLRIRKHDD